ncbi:sigma 54-interacting transcriptional regulator [Flavilitoribacter nigricans]|uniref:RNA polymerase subunit sigma-54 n=1 Tax=Flavilitoribacter nigricans (strain ATCC 23147 / DSM 23189 / NBRC 102662 / NCIMB 1420 / SS-2) TaxID=1122177 RepID=A0A2D0NGZ4_FLAN2|nr:sigma 54-interacting transcriptional regulator [Flavilitoribacter nigricans]PHN07761.1 RNA polymerase subunit sigma-54 [Flavilitoribacter nigricans DSM 23189 = NBRC 102662]
MLANQPLQQVWLLSLSATYSKSLENIRQWLLQKKIDGIPYEKADCDVGIVLLDETCLDESAVASLKACLEKSKHIIAINAGEEILPFYKAWELLCLGIDDILPWRYQEHIAQIIQNRLNRWSIVEHTLESDRISNQLIGSCRKWKKLLRQVVEIACFSNAPVLILGESGTGKELVARLIHDLDKRPDKEDLVLLDCSTIVPDLFGSEFFGHEKGAYTNAVSIREGAFALANKGSLFLDEIGELPLNLQAALLRVIQEGTYKRIGSNQWRKTRFRLISATNRDLVDFAEKGSFRQDLLFRINALTIQLPSLAERKEDIPALAAHFLRQAMNRSEVPDIEKPVLEYLMTREYRGNLRELKQLMSRIAYRYAGTGALTLGCLPEIDRVTPTRRPRDWQNNGLRNAIRLALANGVGLKDIKRSAGDIALEMAVQMAEGQLPVAAKKLGVSERLVQGWWKEKRQD